MISKISSNDKKSVGGIIVTYQPTADELIGLIETVHAQVDRLVLVDNGDGSLLPPTISRYDVDVICLGENLGLAHAQNQGIQFAKRCHCDFVLLLDQDSLPADDMVERLLEAYGELHASGVSIAAVGPCYLDMRQGIVAPFVRRDRLCLKRPLNPEGATTVQVDFLIASGSLIPVEVLERVGLMEEGLFIDYVDIEWGLRAGSKGYNSYGIYRAQMVHRLGDEWKVFLGRRVPIHSPQRQYYQFRNAIWLTRRSWIGWGWRLILVFRLLRQFVFFSLYGRDRLPRMAMMTKGVLDGVLGCTGAFGRSSLPGEPVDSSS